MVYSAKKAVNGKVNGNEKMPSTAFEAILRRMKSVLGVNSDGEIAKKFGVYRQTISQARKKGEVPHKWFFQTNSLTGCSIDWLKNGDSHTEGGANNNLESSTQSTVCEPDANHGNAIEIEHSKIIKHFKDKALAKEINKDLIDLEAINPEAFKEVGSYIKGMVKGLKLATERGVRSDRRKQERRQQDARQKIPNGVDRRSGNDRRRTGT